jgi:hypothetical protein
MPVPASRGAGNGRCRRHLPGWRDRPDRPDRHVRQRVRHCRATAARHRLACRFGRRRRDLLQRLEQVALRLHPVAQQLLRLLHRALREQRVATELEEVVVGANVLDLDADHVRPDLGQLRLPGAGQVHGGKGSVRRPVPPARAGVFRFRRLGRPRVSAARPRWPSPPCSRCRRARLRAGRPRAATARGSAREAWHRSRAGRDRCCRPVRPRARARPAPAAGRCLRWRRAGVSGMRRTCNPASCAAPSRASSNEKVHGLGATKRSNGACWWSASASSSCFRRCKNCGSDWRMSTETETGTAVSNRPITPCVSGCSRPRTATAMSTVSRPVTWPSVSA